MPIDRIGVGLQCILVSAVHFTQLGARSFGGPSFLIVRVPDFLVGLLFRYIFRITHHIVMRVVVERIRKVVLHLAVGIESCREG